MLRQILQSVQCKTWGSMGYLRKKTAINSDKGLTDGGKSQDGVKYDSVSTGTDVISIWAVPIKVQFGN